MRFHYVGPFEQSSMFHAIWMRNGGLSHEEIFIIFTKENLHFHFAIESISLFWKIENSRISQISEHSKASWFRCCWRSSAVLSPWRWVVYCSAYFLCAHPKSSRHRGRNGGPRSSGSGTAPSVWWRIICCGSKTKRVCTMCSCAWPFRCNLSTIYCCSCDMIICESGGANFRVHNFTVLLDLKFV